MTAGNVTRKIWRISDRSCEIMVPRQGEFERVVTLERSDRLWRSSGESKHLDEDFRVV